MRGLATALGAVLALVGGCLSAPARDDGGGAGDGGVDPGGSRCEGPASVRDDFAGDDLSSITWLGIDPALMKLEGGRLVVTLPDAQEYARLVARSAFWLRDGGDRVTVEVGSWPATASVFFDLNTVDQERYRLGLVPDGVVAIAPEGLQDGFVALEDARFDSFVIEDGRLEWQASPDGQTWETIYFEPFVDQAVWFELNVASLQADSFEVAGLNEQLDAADHCGVDRVADDFSGDAPTPMVETNTLGAAECGELAGGVLDTPASCFRITPQAFDFTSGSLSVELAELPPTGLTAMFSIELGDDVWVWMETTDDGVTFRDEVGVLGTSAERSRYQRLERMGEELVAQISPDGRIFEDIGSRTMQADELGAVRVEVGATGEGSVRWDELAGAP